MTLHQERVGIRRILLIVVLLGLAGCSLSTGTPEQLLKDDGPVNKTPIHFVSAEQLGREYTINRHAADMKYKGQYIEVEGAVDGVSRDSHGQVRVVLAGYTSSRTDKLDLKIISCHFAAESQERAADLTRGQQIKICGKCEGEGSSLFVEMGDCQLVKVGADPAVPVTADELGREYAESPAQADKRYLERQLVIEGTFLKLEDDEGRPVAVLTSAEPLADKPLHIRAAYPADQTAAFAQLKPGQRIRIKGECQGKRDRGVLVAFAVLLNK